jgi:hypothetical protein
MRPLHCSPARTRPGSRHPRRSRPLSAEAGLVLDALGRLAHLGIRVHAAHCHGGRAVIIADVPPGVGLWPVGPVEISRPAGGRVSQ